MSLGAVFGFVLLNLVCRNNNNDNNNFHSEIYIQILVGADKNTNTLK